MFLNSKLTFYSIDIINLILSIVLAFLKYGVELQAIVILKNLFLSINSSLFFIFNLPDWTFCYR